MTTLIWERTGVRAPGIIEINWSRIGLAVAVIYDPDSECSMAWMFHAHLFLANIFIHFPGPRISEVKDKHSEWQQWGVHFTREYISFNWKYRYKGFDWPWQWRHVAHTVRRADGSYVPYVGSWERDKEPDGRESFTYPYSYILKNGEVQHVNATVHVERWSRKRHCFWFTNRYDRFRQDISVDFSDEVGERSGSWKGGTIGCSYEMLECETPERTLRRMEQERKF